MVKKRIRVGIIGAGGYGGCGAVELLSRHPDVEIASLIDKQDAGRPISDLYPHLKGFCDLVITAADDSRRPDDFDAVFFATPDGVGQDEAGTWIERGVKVIDYSGDFRFNTTDAYEGYAARIGRSSQHAAPELLEHAVYGLAELHRDEIARSSVVGNPGCFAVSCILGLAPAVREGIVDPDTILCDAKTGVSGAGKNPSPTFHYPARYEAMNVYKVSGHQHVYEIERELGLLAGRNIALTFTPHVVPLCRGILSTLYARLAPGVAPASAEEAYHAFYRNETFVRVFGPDTPLTSSHVRGSNFCNLSVNVDERTRTLIVVSMIDNLVKGQAGSAVQNLNLMFGLEETAGLLQPGQYP
ncbi:MAG: N-acetyl-gamma-glutamyl-phosphate reductase [Desulfobacteraceae bacterium]|jgi:N-acetyl-gamma-glutamyl-phosphate reductase